MLYEVDIVLVVLAYWAFRLGIVLVINYAFIRGNI
jgi:hypothetical protein